MPTKAIQKVALITGASGGLGTVVTQMFLEAGYRLSAVALDWPKPLKPSDVCIVSKADLVSRKAAEAVVRKTLERWGAIHCLAHLVGAYIEGRRVEETSDATWDTLINVNLRTAVNMMRAVIPGMRGQKRGSIAVIGASPAIHPVATWSAMTASVTALCSLVQVAAAELRDDGVTVNALLPTTIATPAVRKGARESEIRKWVDPCSLGSLLLWLASDAGRDVSGALIPVVGRQNHPCYEWHGVTDKRSPSSP
jgi:NAD(P)-dependent dehydrogenase (short-subunit alcohol dehydrogenase family)